MMYELETWQFYKFFDEDFSHFSQYYSKNEQKKRIRNSGNVYRKVRFIIRLVQEKHPRYHRAYYLHKITLRL